MIESFSKPVATDVSGTSTVAVASRTSWVSVADLLAGQAPVHWSEAVAVLAELCTVLLARGDDVIPHAADVMVNGEGELSIRATDRSESDSAALGRMLHGLLATGSAPAPLRLFVTHAISSERYHSVSAFAEGLASYEVPERTKLIQAVNHRWVATWVAAASTVPAPALPPAEPEQKPVKPTAGVRRIPRWAIAAVSVVVVLSGAAGAWFAAGAKPLSLPSVSVSIPAAIQDALSWLDGSKPSDTAAAEPEAQDTKRARAARPRTARARTSDPVLDPATAPGVTETTPPTASLAPPVATVVASEVTATTYTGSDTPATADSATPAPVATGETPGPLDDAAGVTGARVFSSAFPDVEPPVMVTRQFTPPEARTPGVEQASTIELLVDESGGVERVRLLSRPSPILATMLLSAAKTWKFRPALNDGRPVKYRLLLDVTTTRP